MGTRRKLPAEPPVIMCFCCGYPMTPCGNGGYCEDCDVSEIPLEPSLPKMKSFSWGGRPTAYIDHSREHVPSPA